MPHVLDQWYRPADHFQAVEIKRYGQQIPSQEVDQMSVVALIDGPLVSFGEGVTTS